MRKIFQLLLMFSILPVFAEIDKDKIFVVANSNESASLDLAWHYCKLRDIPQKNIISLKIPEHKGYLTRAEYIEHLENPLLSELLSRGAISALDIGSKDSLGRRDFMLTRINTDFIVLCKGIPWGVYGDSKKTAIDPKTSAACVDSEISARFLKQDSFKGFVQNKAFGKSAEFWRSFGLIRVARLDGCDYESIKNNLSKMLKAEQMGLRGRVYIDKSKFAKLGDDWLEAAAKFFGELGFDVSVDNEKATMGFDSRMDAAAVYFGWYSTRPCGYFTMPKFSLADGAIGWHIFSFSALSFAKTSWASTFVSKNAAITDGNVFEPFLALTRNIDVFAKLSYLKRANLLPSEAAFASLPALSWQNMYIGDPLYAPFKKDIKQQLADIENGNIDDLSQYSIIRVANLIDRQRGKKEALAFLNQNKGKMPDNAIVWKIIELSVSESEKSDNATVLLQRAIYKNPQYVGLAFELGELLLKLNRSQEALDLFEGIFAMYKTPIGLNRLAAQRAEEASSKCGKDVSVPVRTVLNKIAQEQIKALERKKNAKKK